MIEDLSGKPLGPFEIQRRIGQGAMGAVYLARHRENGKTVAIKVMVPPNEDAAPKLAARFEREIKLLSAVRHANIVRFIGSNEDRGIRYYAMEFVDGKSLEDVLARKIALPLATAISYTTQICDALQEIHKVGIVHRDLKPANILVTRDGKVKLTDFGIAKDTSALNETRLTAAEHTVGTIAYMSPEQLAGKDLTRKSDLYSLGILLYRMLTGQLPFTGDTVFDYVQQRQTGIYPAPTAVNSALPFEVDALLSELLAQDPNDRPRDAYVVMQRLMDMAKGAKEGTLTKKRPRSTPTVAETVEIKRGRLSTLLSTVFPTRNTKTPKKKTAKQDKKPDRGSMLESPVVLVAALLLVAAFTVYMFWPMSNEQLFTLGKAEFAKEKSSHELKEIYDRYFAPILADDPANPHANEIAAFRDRIGLKQARERVKRASLKDYVPAEDATEPERQYLAALRLKEKRQDRVNADDRFRAIQRVFAHDEAAKPWITLADEQIAGAATYANDDDRIEAKRQAVRAALLRATKLREDEKLKEALDEFADVERLYKSDPETADLVEKAGIEFLPPEDLFARGRRIMEGDDPERWKKAFEFYFEPLERKYPNHENRDAVAAYRDKIAKHEAASRLEDLLKVGLPHDAPEAEVDITTAMYLKRVLGDPYTAHDELARFVGRFHDDPAARLWVLLAKDELADKPMAEDRAAWTQAKQRQARQAVENLNRRIQENSDAAIWRDPVLRIYREDEDTAAMLDPAEK